MPTKWQAKWLQARRRLDVPRAWRGVEIQYLSATLRLVDDLTEHETLEALLEDSKPPLPAAAGRAQHYLLTTPFRSYLMLTFVLMVITGVAILTVIDPRGTHGKAYRMGDPTVPRDPHGWQPLKIRGRGFGVFQPGPHLLSFRRNGRECRASSERRYALKPMPSAAAFAAIARLTDAGTLRTWIALRTSLERQT